MRRTGLLAAALLAISTVSAPARAQVPESVDAVEEALDGVASMTGAAAPLIESSDGFVSTAGGDEITIPDDPAAGIELDLGEAGAISVGLPGATSAKDAVPVDIGTISYDHANPDVVLAAEAPLAGGVRALIIIDGTQAPTEYAFPIELPPGASLEPSADGSIDIVDQFGSTVAFVAPPWAIDATGRPLATSFEVRGNTIVQHVDHRDATYPVVADPWVQGDCGWVTCTIRFDRATTRNVRDAGALIAISAGACSVVSGPAGVICGASIAPSAGLIALAAQRFHEEGKCLGIKFTKNFPPFAWPVSYSRGYMNCR